MQRSLWLLSNNPDVTVRLYGVPNSICTKLVRLAADHQTPFILTDGEWPHMQPESFLRVMRRVEGDVSVVTFILQPTGDCAWLEAPEPEVNLYYSGPIAYDKLVDQILTCIGELLNWQAEESGNAS
jgi:hypothetical protein